MEDKIVPGCIGMLIVMIIGYVIIGAIGGTLKTEVTINPVNTAQVTEETSFEDSMTSNHFLWGLIPGEQPDAAEVLAKYMGAGDQVSEITITTKLTWVNCLVTAVTFGIYVPTTVDIKGKIIKSP